MQGLGLGIQDIGFGGLAWVILKAKVRYRVTWGFNRFKV